MTIADVRYVTSYSIRNCSSSCQSISVFIWTSCACGQALRQAILYKVDQ